MQHVDHLDLAKRFRFVAQFCLLLTRIASSPALIDQFGRWQLATAQKSQLQYASAVESTFAQTRKQTAEAYTQNSIGQIADQILLQDYVYEPGKLPPSTDWLPTLYPNRRTRVLDRNGYCAGEAIHGLFYLRGADPTICATK